jgi:hypothetical protein
MIKPRLPIYILCLLLGLLMWAPSVQAHLTTYTGAERSSTVAEIWIEAERIKVQLEIGAQDREAFANLLNHAVSKPDKVDHDIVLTGDDGMPLKGEVQVMAQRPRTNRSTASQVAAEARPASPMVTYVEIIYTLAEPPATLTLTPPMQDHDRGKAVAEIGFMVYHDSIPVIDFQYLRRPEILQLDWRDPWYSAFKNPDLQRHHRAPIMTFLYIEPYEVRFEMLMRLKTLASWMSLDIQHPMQIGMDEQAWLRQRIGQFVVQQSQVHIDGATSRPLLDRVEFVRVTPQGIQPLETAASLTLNTALVGVILAYIRPGLPQEVTVDWTFFNDQMTSIPSTIIDPVSQLPYDMTPAQPSLHWTNVLDNYNYQAATIDAIAAQAANQFDISLPSVVLGLAALLVFGLGRHLGLTRLYRIVAMMLMVLTAVVVWPFGRIAVRNPLAAPYELPDVEAILILQGLLQNTYRAFDFRAENDVYDKLAVSVSGDLITDLYLQHRQRLEMEEQGGARASVQDVQLLDATPSGPPSQRQRLTFQCTWRITGIVNHWGHAHQRRNQYEARITIQPIEQTWKMMALDLIEERRLP